MSYLYLFKKYFIYVHICLWMPLKTEEDMDPWIWSYRRLLWAAWWGRYEPNVGPLDEPQVLSATEAPLLPPPQVFKPKGSPEVATLVVWREGHTHPSHCHCGWVASLRWWPLRKTKRFAFMEEVDGERPWLPGEHLEESIYPKGTWRHEEVGLESQGEDRSALHPAPCATACHWPWYGGT